MACLKPIVLSFAILLTAGAQTPAAIQPVDRAREAVDWLLNENFQSLFDAFTPEMQKALPLDTLKTRVGPSLKMLGKLRSTGTPVVQKSGTNSVVIIPAKFDTAAVNMQVAIDPAGKIAGLVFRPGQQAAVPWNRPAYSKPDSFTEREIFIGEGDSKLPGTLTLPKGAGPFPAVVLVHGSGPNDRDETVGGFKPFKDLAEGLASRGIAVLRYEKRTRAFAAQAAANKNLTVQEETVADAVLGVALLRSLPEIAPARVFVIGHSLGGYLLPRILAQTKDAAGGVSMAGSTRPLEDLIVEQTEYLASLQSPPSAAAKQRIEDMRKMAADVKALEPGKESGPPVMGMPVHYLLDLRGYNPPAEAAKLKTPLLILQGERDYQVSMKDFANWKAALGGRSDVTFKSYPALNHLFAPGEGKSSPAEYEKPGNVSPEVIDDIAKWIVKP